MKLVHSFGRLKNVPALRRTCVCLGFLAVEQAGCSSDSPDTTQVGLGGSTASSVVVALGGASALTTSNGGASAKSGTGSKVVTSSGGAAQAGGATASAGTDFTGGSTSMGGAQATAISTGAMHWVATWTASPYVDSNANNVPPISLSNSVIRQVTHVSLGGSRIRVQFSNLHGNAPLNIKAAHVATCNATPLVDSTIDVATDMALTFSGEASVTLAQGKEVWSDPIDFAVANQGNITITTAFGSVPATLTQHSGSRTTSYFQSQSAEVSAPNMASAVKKDLWFFISGIDVMAESSARTVVAIGDSITDGRGTDSNANNRWTDVLAARLQANPATATVAMANEAIGATNLSGTGKTTAQSRFARDVIGQSGVKYVIVYDGVNDVGYGTQFDTMKAAYEDLITRAHANGLLIYGATLLPFYGNTYYDKDGLHEEVRQKVNAYIRGGAFDGYIDFDAALTDGGTPPKLQSNYATWRETDWLHPGPEGYKAMGNTVDLSLFER